MVPGLRHSPGRASEARVSQECHNTLLSRRGGPYTSARGSTCLVTDADPASRPAVTKKITLRTPGRQQRRLCQRGRRRPRRPSRSCCAPFLGGTPRGGTGGQGARKERSPRWRRLLLPGRSGPCGPGPPISTATAELARSDVSVAELHMRVASTSTASRHSTAAAPRASRAWRTWVYLATAIWLTCRSWSATPSIPREAE